jgi:hypothetical protein
MVFPRGDVAERTVAPGITRKRACESIREVHAIDLGTMLGTPPTADTQDPGAAIGIGDAAGQARMPLA